MYVFRENLPLLQDRQTNLKSRVYTTKVAQRHLMFSGSLALLYFLLGFHGGRQGSGPDRGQSHVEWGDFPSVRPSVCPSVRPHVRTTSSLGHPVRPEAQPAREGNRQTDRQTDVGNISPFYRTLSPIRAAALLPKGSSRPIKSRAREPLTI